MKKTYHDNKRKETANCLLAVDLWHSSFERMQMHPPSKWGNAWAKAKRMEAATPSLKAP